MIPSATEHGSLRLCPPRLLVLRRRWRPTPSCPRLQSPSSRTSPLRFVFRLCSSCGRVSCAGTCRGIALPASVWGMGAIVVRCMRTLLKARAGCSDPVAGLRHLRPSLPTLRRRLLPLIRLGYLLPCTYIPSIFRSAQAWQRSVLGRESGWSSTRKPWHPFLKWKCLRSCPAPCPLSANTCVLASTRNGQLRVREQQGGLGRAMGAIMGAHDWRS